MYILENRDKQRKVLVKGLLKIISLVKVNLGYSQTKKDDLSNVQD